MVATKFGMFRFRLRFWCFWEHGNVHRALFGLSDPQRLRRCNRISDTFTRPILRHIGPISAPHETPPPPPPAVALHSCRDGTLRAALPRRHLLRDLRHASFVRRCLVAEQLHPPRLVCPSERHRRSADHPPRPARRRREHRQQLQRALVQLRLGDGSRPRRQPGLRHRHAPLRGLPHQHHPRSPRLLHPRLRLAAMVRRRHHRGAKPPPSLQHRRHLAHHRHLDRDPRRPAHPHHRRRPSLVGRAPRLHAQRQRDRHQLDSRRHALAALAGHQRGRRRPRHRYRQPLFHRRARVRAAPASACGHRRSRPLVRRRHRRRRPRAG